jgi:hypothetical protein
MRNSFIGGKIVCMAVTQPDFQDFSKFRIGQVGSTREYPRPNIEYGKADKKWEAQLALGNIFNERDGRMQLNDPNKLTSTEMFGKDLVERGGSVPIPGADIMEDLMTVEIGENNDTADLEEALRRAWAFREGLTLGPRGEAYNFKATEVSLKLETKTKVKKLQNLMTTVEGSVERPRADYVEVAIEEALDKRIREAQLYKDDPARYEAKIRKKLEDNYRIELTEIQVAKIVKSKINNLAKDYVAIPKLTELSNHSKVRATFDRAFQDRMRTCEDPGKAAKLGGEYSTPTPDGQHFETLFKGEGDYGQKVNEVFEEMVKIALPEDVVTRLGMEPIPDDVRKFVPENVYGVGFDNATMFATWTEYMIKKADGRMDVVWGAWKLALTFEVIDDLGQSINAKGKFALASPPLGNPLMTYLAHWNEKTTTEFGWNAKGERTQKEKFVAHSGLPLTFGRVPNLCEQYFIEAKVGFDQTYLDKPWMLNLINNAINNLPQEGDGDYESECFARQNYFDKLRGDLIAFRDRTKANHNGKLEDVNKINISLWDIWLYGRISFADKDFPWFATDQAEIDPSNGELPTSGELPSGSVGMWYLTRGRCWGDKGGVGNDLKSLPMLKDLGSPDFFTSRVRTWAKVLGTVSDDLPTEENVRMWWMLAVCAAHQTDINRDTSGIANLGTPKSRNKNLYASGGNPILNETIKYVLFADSERPGIQRVGMEQRGVSWAEIFGAATQCGFLRGKDVQFIRETLNIQDIF